MSSRGSSSRSRKKESPGAGAQRNAERVAAGGKARGRPASTAKSATESIHERSARLQREGNLPREARPGERLTPIRTDLPYRNIDPFSAPDPTYLIRAYGEHQLGRALNDFTVDMLKRTAQNVGVTPEEARQKGLKLSSRAGLVSAITAHVTGGRYSANFGTLKSGGTKSGGSRSTSSAAGPATRDSLATRAATLGRQLGTAQRSGNTAQREQLINDLEALIQQYRALGG